MLKSEFMKIEVLIGAKDFLIEDLIYFTEILKRAVSSLTVVFKYS